MGGHLATGPVVGHWVAQRVGAHFGNATALGWIRNGRIVSGVMYEDWNGRSLVAHIATEAPLVPGFCSVIFHYPFIQVGAEKIISPIHGHNPKSMKLALKMGFEEEGRIKEAHPTGDIALMVLHRDKCRFLGERYLGKIVTVPAPGT